MSFAAFFSFGGNPIFTEEKNLPSHPEKSSASDQSISGEGERGFLRLILNLGLEIDTGGSQVSSSFGVGRRSKELEEAEVKAEVEEDDLSVKVDLEGILLVVTSDCSSGLAETASLFDVRRAEEVVD